MAQDPEEEVEALESYPETDRNIVPLVVTSHSPGVFEEVRLAKNLLVFRFSQNYTIDASSSAILIDVERPVEISNFFLGIILSLILQANMLYHP